MPLRVTSPFAKAISSRFASGSAMERASENTPEAPASLKRPAIALPRNRPLKLRVVSSPPTCQLTSGGLHVMRSIGMPTMRRVSESKLPSYPRADFEKRMVTSAAEPSRTHLPRHVPSNGSLAIEGIAPRAALNPRIAANAPGFIVVDAVTSTCRPNSRSATREAHRTPPPPCCSRRPRRRWCRLPSRWRGGRCSGPRCGSRPRP